MRITVNGEPHEHEGAGTVAALLEELGAARERVAVLLNGNVVRRHALDAMRLAEGDEVEVLTFAAGG